MTQRKIQQRIVAYNTVVILMNQTTPTRIKVVTKMDIVGVKDDSKNNTESGSLIERKNSNGSIESKVESIYINNIQNNITVNQNINQKNKNTEVNCSCCGFSSKKDRKFNKNRKSPACRFLNLGVFLALCILTGMGTLMVPIFDFVDNQLKLPLFTAGLVITVVSSVVYCRYNQLADKRKNNYAID